MRIELHTDVCRRKGAALLLKDPKGMKPHSVYCTRWRTVPAGAKQMSCDLEILVVGEDGVVMIYHGALARKSRNQIKALCIQEVRSGLIKRIPKAQ